MTITQIQGSIALVTGANRGIGRAIVEALLARGATKVYAAARKPEAVADLVERHNGRVEAIELDVTNVDQVRALVERTMDVNLLFNNAGVAQGLDLASEQSLEAARNEMEVNYFAPLRLVQQFAPILRSNGGGAIVNIVSVAGLASVPLFPTYSASKAAVHSLTQGARALLRGQGTTVFGVYPGPIDTDMAKRVEGEKATPEATAEAILDGIEAGASDIYPDAFSRTFGEQFEASPKASEQQLAGMVTAA